MGQETRQDGKTKEAMERGTTAGCGTAGCGNIGTTAGEGRRQEAPRQVRRGRRQGRRERWRQRYPSKDMLYQVLQPTTPIRRQLSEIVVGNEGRDSKVRTISKPVAEYRDCGEILRALIAPVKGISGEREQLRYLQYAVNVN